MSEGGPVAAPRAVRVDLLGGDPLGRGDQPGLSWWLPTGATRQTAYRIVTDDGYDSGRVESDRQSFVEVPVFDRSRRVTSVRVQVWTDAGESAWSEPVPVDSGLLASTDWTASWVGVDEAERAPKGGRPAYWLRSVIDVEAVPGARLLACALGIYEAYVNGVRVGDEELAPGLTQYLRRVAYQSHDVTGLLRPGRNVIAVLLADGWYRGQVGMPRLADQFGTELALRLQLESLDGDSDGGDGWTPLAATDATWRTGPSHIVAADLIGGQREDRRLVDRSRRPCAGSRRSGRSR